MKGLAIYTTVAELLVMLGCFLGLFEPTNRIIYAIALVLNAPIFYFGFRYLGENKKKDYKKCPACAEYIKQEATVCRHCGREL